MTTLSRICTSTRLNNALFNNRQVKAGDTQNQGTQNQGTQNPHNQNDGVFKIPMVNFCDYVFGHSQSFKSSYPYIRLVNYFDCIIT